MSSISPSIDQQEIEKFSSMAEEWWDENGKFKPLHKFNPTRIKYIKDKIIQKFTSFSSITLLDIGCGGGLLCEPMTRLGAKVTGIDASEKNIKIASLHAQEQELDINYICTSAEELAEKENKFDVVLSMEVIEHVADVESFLKACHKLLKPGGLLFIATINRTVKSLLLAKIGAEYILKWLPRGTHDWKKFLRPSEIWQYLSKENLQILEIKGMSYNLINSQWSLSDDISVNYIMVLEHRI